MSKTKEELIASVKAMAGKIENKGKTPEGKLSSEEFNDAVELLALVAERLVESQDSGGDQTGCQNYCGGGALYKGCHEQTKYEAQQRISGHVSHYALHRSGRLALEAVAHYAHSVQEQRKTTKQRYKIEYCHLSLL